MVKVELETPTLAVLVAGMYCTNTGVDSMAIPQSLWMEIAEKLEYFIGCDLWDFSKISFEDWINTSLFIYPKIMIDEGDLEDMQKTTLYWEHSNGNIMLSVSMDIRAINGE